MSETFVLHTTVRFADVDSAGIHFYPRYFERVNQTVEEWFEQALGCSFNRLHHELKTSVPTVHFNVDFLSPSRLEERLTYSLRVERIGGASAGLRIRICCGEDMRVDVRQTLVMMDMANSRPRPWPEEIRERMRVYLVEGGEG